MKPLLASVALLALTGAAAGQTIIQLPSVVVQPPPVVITPPPIVVTPPPIVVAPPPPPPPPPPPVCVVTGPPWVWLNLRTYPNGPILGALPPGTALALFQVSGRWGFVQTPIGPGWAFLPYTICNF
jgi:hypothetical protein